jgi:hypothetical protein
MKRYLLLVVAVLAVVAYPQRAWANAGTPLMWAGMLHLAFGNLVIGIGEGLLLAWLFSVPKGKSVLVMIPANYASAWVGGLFLRGAIVRELPMDLNNGWRWFWVMVALTYCMTLVLEWPFIAWCLRGTQGWFRRSVRASLVVQSASYVLLFGWYWGASGTSLYTKMNIVAPSELSLPESVLVYFIAPRDGNVYTRQLAGGDERLVYDLHSTDANDRLLIRASTPDTNAWDLVARVEIGERRDPKSVVIRTNMQVEAAPDRGSTQANPPRSEGTWFNFGEAPPLGSAREGRWEFRSGFWPIEGFRASNKGSGEIVRFSYETPFGAWAVRNAVHLPSDKVLFQLGDDQICAFDPASRKIALLWRGRGPVPIIARSKGELAGAANDSPSFSSGTNRTASAAGFGR